jgi:pimeloyl-ACP methyl ester carboxylesterase
MAQEAILHLPFQRQAMSDFQHGPIRLHYQWRDGAGQPARPGQPTLVFLHDGLGAAAAWKALPQKLAAALGANSLAYDRHGYGQSSPRASFPDRFMEGEVPVLVALLAHLGIERPHLIGHSDGGSIALLYAARYPERVGAVVTIAAHTIVEPETQAGIRALLALQAEGRTPAWLGRLHGERADALLSAWAKRWLSEPHGRWDIRDEVGGVRCPLLVIQGERDEFGTRAQVDSILSRVPGAEHWIVPGCGHTPYHAEEAAFLERVAGFLRPRLAAPAAAG